MSKLNGKIVKAVRVKNTDLGRVIGESLQKLRELAGLTQTQIAARLNVGQAAISKIEHRGDVQISSLQKYVEALGATLRIFSSMKQHVTISTETRISPGEAYRSAN
jgi:transcriptional regulator with XRE-family HTH domain